jgi:hypothetical protein
VAFNELERVAKAIGFDSDREQDHKATLGVIRAANGRIRELEQQLAGSVSGEALAQAVKKACDSIYPAWKQVGFNYAGDVKLGSRYLEAKLSCDADDGMFTQSETPESDKESAKQKRATLEDRGITFSGDGRQRQDRSALDTDANRAAIADVVREVWPQARITKWESGYTVFGRTDNFIIRYAWVLIPIESLMGEAAGN